MCFVLIQSSRNQRAFQFFQQGIERCVETRRIENRSRSKCVEFTIANLIAPAFEQDEPRNLVRALVHHFNRPTRQNQRRNRGGENKHPGTKKKLLALLAPFSRYPKRRGR